MPTFKGMRFRSGLNVLLADRSEGATELQTRNGAGKTSLIELIHFCTGAGVDKTSVFRNKTLSGSYFGMDFDLKDSRTVIERSGENARRVVVRQADTSAWPIKPTRQKSSDELVISNNNWRVVLGQLMFGLTESTDGEQAAKFGPTFRALFSYFVRRQMANAFSSPVKQADMQQLWDQQVAISYLLGLDWTIAQQWQEIREKEKQLKELRRVASEGTLGRDGALGYIVGNIASLRTKLAVAEERARRLRETVQNFRILPEYRELEMEASQLTRQIGARANENTIDRELLSELEHAVEREADPSSQDLARLYEEVGVALPNVTVRRFADVEEFHKSVTDNRRSYLNGELEDARQRIDAREEEMQRMDARRSHIMRILGSHGALDQYMRLQRELTEREADVEDLRRQFAAAEQLEGRKTELQIERQQQLRRLRQDYSEQRDTLNQAILAFEETSRALYEEAGNLTIEESLNGPRFEVTIQAAKSKGISNMQIFCFDMMLMQVCSRRGIGPGFLVHDSHLFDGVDERQVAAALRLGARIADKENFQYIVTMNSDALPENTSRDFAIEDHILPVRLTDATEEGGLFGVRF
jgi:uncharacterized protein YydD (DUF2326 family)